MPIHQNRAAQLALINDIDAISWMVENKELIYQFEADLLLEQIKIDQWNRTYGFLIEEYCPSYRTKEDLNKDINHLLNEGFWTDIAIGVGSMIPGIGSIVAAGGTVYYIYNMIKAFSDGNNTQAFFEGLSALFTAGQIIPAVGAALGAAGKIIMAPLKGAMKGLGILIKGAGGALGKTAVGTMGKAAGKGAGAFGKTTMEFMKSSKGKIFAKFAPLGQKLLKIVSPMTNFFTKGAGSKLLSKMGVPIEKLKNGLFKVNSMIESLGKMGKSAAANSVDDVAREGAELGFAMGNLSRKEADDIIAQIGKQSETLAAQTSKLGAGKTLQKGAISSMDDFGKSVGAAAQKMSDDIMKAEITLGKKAGQYAGSKVQGVMPNGRLVITHAGETKIISNISTYEAIKGTPALRKIATTHLDDAGQGILKMKMGSKALDATGKVIKGGAGGSAIKVAKAAKADITKLSTKILGQSDEIVKSVGDDVAKALAATPIKIQKSAFKVTDHISKHLGRKGFMPGDPLKVVGAEISKNGQAVFKVVNNKGLEVAISPGNLQAMVPKGFLADVMTKNPMIKAIGQETAEITTRIAAETGETLVKNGDTALKETGEALYKTFFDWERKHLRNDAGALNRTYMALSGITGVMTGASRFTQEQISQMNKQFEGMDPIDISPEEMLQLKDIEGVTVPDFGEEGGKHQAAEDPFANL